MVCRKCRYRDCKCKPQRSRGLVKRVVGEVKDAIPTPPRDRDKCQGKCGKTMLVRQMLRHKGKLYCKTDHAVAVKKVSGW